MDIAQQAARIVASTWRGRVESADVFQEAALLVLERPAAKWRGHTRSYLVQTLKGRLWARLIRKRWYRREKGQLRRVVELPLLDDGSGQQDAGGYVHLGGWE